MGDRVTVTKDCRIVEHATSEDVIAPRHEYPQWLCIAVPWEPA
ncbi:hypothetical protein [Micromonospora lutea]|uniref:Uncharacterized protein n=1 Tax=Micromonospora lutea TaxID=419825 RepID=A0ABQ4J2V5_9ACTN|nr:hypothetical protein [Micromonospora lutea]GIJ24496.1 hypothetical protein Vlu01_51200 [Micromonospora lutea]